MGMCLMSLINVYVALNLARVENVKLANVLKGNKGFYMAIYLQGNKPVWRWTN